MVEPDPEPPPLPAEMFVAPTEIGFRNSLAVRISLLFALATFGLSVVYGPLMLLWMLIAGIGAAWLYTRRTGEELTALSGARLGWITGLFIFLILAILVGVMALAMTDQTAANMFLEQMRQRGAEDKAQMAIEVLQDPGKLAEAIVLFFLFCGLVPVLGGVLGARLFRGTAS